MYGRGTSHGADLGQPKKVQIDLKVSMKINDFLLIAMTAVAEDPYFNGLSAHVTTNHEQNNSKERPGYNANRYKDQFLWK